MAEQTSPPEKALKAVIETYPQLNSATPSSWYAWSTDGAKHIIQLCEICHAQLTYYNPGYQHIITAFPKQGELDIKYIRMLISGPFRAFSDLISLNVFEDNYYIQVDHLDRVPAKVLYNFMIASRVPIEFDHLYNNWTELCKAGYPEVLAWLLSYSTNGKPFKGERFHFFPRYNHFFIDNASDWKRILSGNPDMKSPSFYENPKETRPCNVIWGMSDDYRKIMHMDDEQVVEFFGLKIAEKPKKAPAKPKIKPYLNAGLADWVVGNAQNLDAQVNLDPQALHNAWNNAIDNFAGVQVLPDPVQLHPQPPIEENDPLDEFDDIEFPDLDD